MALSIKQLENFRALMLAGTMAEAARDLGRTQPAVSSMLTTLEDELGYQLFKRERRRLVPTPEAYYLLEESEKIIERLALTSRTMKEIGQLDRGLLRIASHPASSNVFIPKIVSKFVDGKKDVRVSMMMRSSDVVAELVASQQYDIALAETPPSRKALNIKSFEMICVVAIPKSDRLAEKEVVSPCDLDNQPMATLFQDHHTYTNTKKVFDACNAHLNRQFELRTFRPALELVEAGICYSICDPITAKSYKLSKKDQARITFRPLDPPVHCDVAIITPAHRPLSKLATSFYDVLEEELLRIQED